MLHSLVQFCSSLAWWEWLIGIPAAIMLGIVAFGLIMRLVVTVAFLALTNRRVGNFLFSVLLLLSICAVGGIIARHL